MRLNTDTDVKVIKYEEKGKDERLAYAFCWQQADPGQYYVYFKYEDRWAEPVPETDVKEMVDNESWVESDMSDVFVNLGWTEKAALMQLMNQIPNGWETLARNLHLAAQGEEGLKDLPPINAEQEKVIGMANQLNNFYKEMDDCNYLSGLGW